MSASSSSRLSLSSMFPLLPYLEGKITTQTCVMNHDLLQQQHTISAGTNSWNIKREEFDLQL
jgi:hypothetical protein